LAGAQANRGMTSEERRVYAEDLRRATRKVLARLNRPKRERKLREGPDQAAEQAGQEIFAADLLCRDELDSPGPGA